MTSRAMHEKGIDLPGVSPAPESPNGDETERLLRIHGYALRTLAAEVVHIEKAALDTPSLPDTAPVPEFTLNNLRDRPHIVRLIESRAGGWILGALQHAIWALRHRVRMLREWRTRFSREATMPVAIADGDPPAPPAPMIPGPSLSSVPFDREILTRRPRILLDVTPTARQPDAQGGIPRVIRELAEAAVATGLALPVRIEDGALFCWFDHPLMRGQIEPQPDDVYVIADVFWYFLDEYQTSVRLVRSKGAKVAIVVHDIFPLTFPSFFPSEVPPNFESGLLRLLSVSHYCVAVSSYTREQIRSYLMKIDSPAIRRLKFDQFRPGAARKMLTDGSVRQLISDIFQADHIFLSVGTLEPRKGYDVTLDACEIAWKTGARFVYVILGRFGWRANALRDRIQNHPEFERRLFWISDANDAELAVAYSKCRSLIQSSIMEGFGLPIIEAATLGAPVIASDLEVFKEIGGSDITFYKVGSAPDLAARLLECLTSPRRVVRVHGWTWTESIRSLASCLEKDDLGVHATRELRVGLRDLPDSAPPPFYTSWADRETPTSGGVRDAIHVACCFDDKMAIPACVLAASIAATTTDAPVILYMVHPPGISISIDELRERIANASFTIMERLIEEDLSSLYSTTQYTDAMYYRFLLPGLIDNDRVIYLDCDTIARRSLTELWRIDLHGHPVAAVTDFCITHHMRNQDMPFVHKGKEILVDDYALEVLDFDLTTTDYFNSGVLVMDLKAWRNMNIAERCMKFCKDMGELNTADQDAANHVLQGDFLQLDPRWNSFSYLYHEYFPAVGQSLPDIFGGFQKNLRPPKCEWLEVLKVWAFDPWIVHFAYRSKPWRADHRRTDFDTEFWEFAFKTPFGDRLYQEFLSTQTAVS